MDYIPKRVDVLRMDTQIRRYIYVDAATNPLQITADSGAVILNEMATADNF